MSIAVAIPTYGRPRQLARAIVSALRQSLPASQIVISDDGNDIRIRELVASYQDPRLIYVGQKVRLGLVRNWQYVMGATECDFVALLEDDNFWRRDHLRWAIEGFDMYPTVDIYHCRHAEAREGPAGLEYYKLVSPPWAEGGNALCWAHPSLIVADALGGGSINSSTVVARMKALCDLPPFDQRFIMGMDTMMWTRLGFRSGAAFGRYVGTVYTYHGGNASNALITSGRAVTQARAARRVLLRELALERPGVVGDLCALLPILPDEQLANALVLLGDRRVPSELRMRVGAILETNPSIRARNRYLKATRLLGLWALRYADQFDHARAGYQRMRLSLSYVFEGTGRER